MLVGEGLAWAAAQAQRAIHDHDLAGLKQLLAEYPALLSWHSADRPGGLVGFAAGAYGDAGSPERERWFTRAEAAELLIDAGAVVSPAVCHSLLQSRARGLLQLFMRKGVLPRSLRFLAALGDPDAVRAALEADTPDLTRVNEALLIACRFEHQAVAAMLLERAIALDPDFGKRVDGGVGRPAFIAFLCAERALEFVTATPGGPWQAFVMEQAMRAAQDGGATALADLLRREPWLLGDDWVGLQIGIIERAVLRDHAPVIAALFDLEPALVRRRPAPPSTAVEVALTYAKPHLLPLLGRVWPLPDDLPHAAGTGNLARVRQWFDASGAPALGDLDRHYPRTSPHLRQHDDLRWGPPTVQHVLDTALAWAVVNRHFDVADFLLAHGANINTDWNSHEPASILHHLVFEDNFESMQYLIDRGIDMTIRDYRWNSTAAGWARHAKQDERMAQWLEEQERQRTQAAP